MRGSFNAYTNAIRNSTNGLYEFVVFHPRKFLLHVDGECVRIHALARDKTIGQFLDNTILKSGRRCLLGFSARAGVRSVSQPLVLGSCTNQRYCDYEPLKLTWQQKRNLQRILALGPGEG